MYKHDKLEPSFLPRGSVSFRLFRPPFTFYDELECALNSHFEKLFKQTKSKMENFIANLVKGTDQAVLVDDRAKLLARSVSKSCQLNDLRLKSRRRKAPSRWSSEGSLDSSSHSSLSPPVRTTARCNSSDNIEISTAIGSGSERLIPHRLSRWNSSSHLDALSSLSSKNVTPTLIQPSKSFCNLPPKQPTRRMRRQDSISILRQRNS